MGFDHATIQLLLMASEAGVSFDRVLTIGRQGLHVQAEELRAVLAAGGIRIDAGQADRILTGEKGFCEPLLKLLGAGRVDSLDVSAYEGATILHDMNQPMDASHHEKFSLVIDGGSLEHVFHFPTALKNCMQAVALGGHFLTITPANNLMGHGFYQLSPELFFRALSPANGFEIVKVMLYESTKPSEWYQVIDPEQVRSRVELVNQRPTYLMAWAKRTASVPIFEQTPQQSDYASIWQRSGDTKITVADTRARPPASFWKRYAPKELIRLYRLIRPYRPRFYKKVSGAAASPGGR